MLTPHEATTPSNRGSTVSPEDTTTHLPQSMILSVCHVQHIETPAVGQALRRKEGCLCGAAVPQASAIAPDLHLEGPRHVRNHNPADAETLGICASAAACMVQIIWDVGG